MRCLPHSPLRAAFRYEQAKAGQSAARNHGLALARGLYIAMLDDDDLWPADKLIWQGALLASDPSIGVVAGGAEVIDEARRPIRVRLSHPN